MTKEAGLAPREKHKMHRYLPHFAARPVPRYTSYPTAAEFTDGIGGRDQADAIAAIAPGDPISLYLHIPYCHSICWYCGCNTGAVGRVERLTYYVEALVAEIAHVGRRCAGRVQAVHFGGGSPNALSPAQMLTVAGALRAHFDLSPDAEWAAEIDPRSFTAGHASALNAMGVGRLSVGAQTFAPIIQGAIGRIQPFATVAKTIALARNAGIDRINLDLMYGLPGQSLDDIAATLAAARTLAPDRVAMFGYAHMPKLLPRQRRIDASTLPEPEARFWQRALAHDLLLEWGMQAIGFDHFARPDDSLAIAARTGQLRRNFQGFTDDPSPTLIGLGASAISQFDGLIVQNEKHVGRYRMLAANGIDAGVRGVRRDAEDRLRARVIEQLLCTGRFNLGRLTAAIRPPRHAWDELCDAGIVTRDGDEVSVTPSGQPYARLAAVLFDRHRGPEARFSQAI